MWAGYDRMVNEKQDIPIWPGMDGICARYPAGYYIQYPAWPDNIQPGIQKKSIFNI